MWSICGQSERLQVFRDESSPQPPNTYNHVSNSVHSVYNSVSLNMYTKIPTNKDLIREATRTGACPFINSLNVEFAQDAYGHQIPCEPNGHHRQQLDQEKPHQGSLFDVICHAAECQEQTDKAGDYHDGVDGDQVNDLLLPITWSFYHLRIGSSFLSMTNCIYRTCMSKHWRCCRQD